MAELLADVPDRALAIYAHPDDPDVSCGGTLAALGQGRVRGAPCSCAPTAARDRRPGAATDRTWSRGGPAEASRRGRAARAGRPGVPRLSRRRADRRPGLPGGPGGGGPAAAPRDRALPRSDGGLLRPGVLQPPRPPDRPDGRRSTPCPRPPPCPTTSPTPGRPTRWTRSCCRAPSSPTCGSTSPPPSTSRATAVGCHRSQFPDGVEWASTAVRLGAEDAGRQAGVAFAEGFRRLRLGG